MARHSRGASRNWDAPSCPAYNPVVTSFSEDSTTVAQIVVEWDGTPELPGLTLFCSINGFPPFQFFDTGPVTSGGVFNVDISDDWGVDDSVTIYAVLNGLPGPCPNQQSPATEPVVWL